MDVIFLGIIALGVLGLFVLKGIESWEWLRQDRDDDWQLELDDDELPVSDYVNEDWYVDEDGAVVFDEPEPPRRLADLDDETIRDWGDEDEDFAQKLERLRGAQRDND